MGFAILRIVLDHYGDWTEYTEKYEVNVTNPYYIPLQKEGYNYEVMAIRGPNNSAREFLQKLRRHKDVHRIMGINKLRNNSYEIVFFADYYTSVKRIFVERHLIIKDFKVRNGLEYYTLIVPRYNKDLINELRDALEEISNVMSINVERVDKVPSHAYSELTDIERKILEVAYSKGYFDYPRKMNLDDLAMEFNISKTTANYHIRNALKKILSYYFRHDELRNIPNFQP